jgi:hypothetical protein
MLRSRKLDPSDPKLMFNWFCPSGDGYYVWHTRDIEKNELLELCVIDFNPLAPENLGMAKAAGHKCS